MNPGDEAVSPATGDPPPPAAGPVAAAPPDHASPTPETVLKWIAAGGTTPWFPSVHARETGVPRDSLDGPLAELRIAGLVRVADWVKGRGQGYVATPDGLAAAAAGAVMPPAPAPAPAPADAPTTEVPPLVPEVARTKDLDIRPPVVTPALLAANLIWFFVGLVIAVRVGVGAGPYLADGTPPILHRLGAVTGFDLLRGDWWRLLTSCFVHIGAIHLIANVVALAMTGPLAELLWGRWRLLIIYLVSGLAGACLAMANRPDSMLAGASGALWGVLTSLLAWVLLFRPYLPPDMTADWFRRLGSVFLINAGVSLLPGVSWEGHLGGGVAGFLAAGLLNAVRFGDRQRRAGARVLLVVLPVLCVAGLLLAMKSGEKWAALRQSLNAGAVGTRVAEFNREVAPLLAELAPDRVRPVEDEAARVWLQKPDRRKAAAAEARAKVEHLRATAGNVAGRLTDPPTGVEAVDRHRDRAKAFADARVRSFDLLLKLLDPDAPPDPAAVKAWGESRREAERLWAEIGKN